MNKSILANSVTARRFPVATVLEHPALRLSGGRQTAGRSELPLLGVLQPGEVIGLSGAQAQQQRLVAAWLACMASADSGVLWLTDSDPVALRTDCLAIDSGQSRNYVQALLGAMKYGLANGDALSRLAVAENLFVFRGQEVGAAALKRIGSGFHHQPLRLIIIESLPAGLDLDSLRRLATRLGAAVLWLGADQPVQRRLQLKRDHRIPPRGQRQLLECGLLEGSATTSLRLRVDCAQARVDRV